MIEADNTFSGIFGNKLSTPQEPEPIAQQEDTPAIMEQAETEAAVATEHQLLQEERETNGTEKSARKRGRRRKDTGCNEDVTTNNAGHFSCICDKDLIAKVRAIAWQEHLTIRAVVESMFTKCIVKYEKKRGPIQIVPNQPSEELF